MPRPLLRLPSRRAAPAVTALVVAALTLTAGCSGKALDAGAADPAQHPTTPTRSTPQTQAPPPVDPPPSEGACRRLTYDAIGHYTNAAAVVSCGSPHNAYTFAVRRLPAGVDVTGVSIGNRSVQEAAAQGCQDAYAGFIGGDGAQRALTRLSVTYFLPVQVQFNRGAHWVRCDVVALAASARLTDLPGGDLDGYLDKPVALRRYGVCSAGPPGESSSALVICTEEHTYRALTALRLGTDAGRYPGETVTRARGQQRCADYIAEKLGPGGGYTYGWTYPTPADWQAGQRFGYCWSKTSH